MAGITMTHPEKVAACFKEAGFDFDITHFDNRLIAQKLVFLLQKLGVKMGYEDSYNFYLRGTYSPTLTKDLFGSPEHPGLPAPGNLSPEEKANVAKLVGSIELRPHLLEVMAAYLYLRDHGQSEVQARRTIKTTKPFLSERDIAIGISKCKGLYPETTPEDLDDLEAEMAPWDAASAEDVQ